jgi:hypothetical protein
MRVRIAPVPVVRTSRTTIVANANEHDSTVAVGETHRGVHQLFVSQRGVAFREKFGSELLSAREQPAEFFVSEHAMNLSCRRESGIGYRTAATGASE